MDIRELIAAERHRLADLLDTLTGPQLATPSLCGAWTVKDVAGHLVAVVDTPGSALLKLLVTSGLRLHRANARLAVQVAARPAGDLAVALRRHADSPFRPPIVGYPGALTDLQVHLQDIRRPLGLPHDLTPQGLRISLDFLTGGRAVGFTPRRRVAGLRLEADDQAWVKGDGLLVRGSSEALMMALCGRAAVRGELTGDGVGTLLE
ncbi:MAG TPA: maleylpyruvate isomerase family mycothiol-dependent enzyme [Actinoplanes sp.]|nr:maleylpyruvate isomerase family mycothiol-dependent enzyme [Actinoplanes sp.]